MSETSVALTLLRTDQYKGIAKSIRLTSDLATICVKDFEAKFVVKAHDQEEKFACAVNACAREVNPPALLVARKTHQRIVALCDILISDESVFVAERDQGRGGGAGEKKSEVARSTVHQVYTVTGVRARYG
jgi:hypothetical protein